MRVFRNTGRIAHDSHFKLDVPIGEEPGLEVLEDMFFESYVCGGDFFMDQKTSHMVWLADEAPWIATEILADDERIAGNKLRLRHNVK
jgi:hypothetical protein